jgi:hypothetical protein
MRRRCRRCLSACRSYVFGNSKTFKRVQLPRLFEVLSRTLKTSIVLFWGR